VSQAPARRPRGALQRTGTQRPHSPSRSRRRRPPHRRRTPVRPDPPADRGPRCPPRQARASRGAQCQARASAAPTHSRSDRPTPVCRPPPRITVFAAKASAPSTSAIAIGARARVGRSDTACPSFARSRLRPRRRTPGRPAWRFDLDLRLVRLLPLEWVGCEVEKVLTAASLHLSPL